MKVVSYFDKTGNVCRPWADDGYDCFCIDLTHPREPYTKDNITFIRWDLGTPWLPDFDRSEIALFSAFPPCTDIAVSGARWFKDQSKSLRSLARSMNLFASAQEFAVWCQAPYYIENPVSVIATHWRKHDHSYQPFQYAQLCADDNYTKKTCLWTGNNFHMPPPTNQSDLFQTQEIEFDAPDDRIHKATPSVNRADFRAATPMGFSRAVYLANKI